MASQGLAESAEDRLQGLIGQRPHADIRSTSRLAAVNMSRLHCCFPYFDFLCRRCHDNAAQALQVVNGGCLLQLVRYRVEVGLEVLMERSWPSIRSMMPGPTHGREVQEYFADLKGVHGIELLLGT